MSQINWLNHTLEFPSTSLALDDPNGLLAIGGDLRPERLLAAYRKGIFPWFSEGQPILWWSPSPRMILKPSEIHIGRSNKKLLKRNLFSITIDSAFDEVINHCAMIERGGQEGTWITEEMSAAYLELHKQGYAHSIEAWQNDSLVGGLYGISIGKAFFGESMFSNASGASKVAFVALAKMLQKWEYKLIDCQIHTDYLESFGATEVTRNTFETILAEAILEQESHSWAGNWLSEEHEND